MATALALSGGGAKGSFEVGALQYLYENGFLANIICGTSVGSVNAIQLAHGGTAATQAAAFTTLKTIWQSELVTNEDMYVEAAWLAGVTPRTRAAVASLFTGVDLPGIFSQAVFFPPYAIGQAVALGADLKDALDGFATASSVFTLAPIRAKIGAHLNAATVAASGVELRLVSVSLDSGAIRYVTQTGRVVETDGRQVAGPNPAACRTERSAYQTALNAQAAESRALARADRMDRGEIRREYREANAAAIRTKAALDRCMAAAGAAGTANALTVTLADGVIASASIPCVFPPVLLGDESYVDGGIRWVLPLQAAVDFDPEFIVAINASLAGVPPARRSYRNATLLDIAERSVLDILMWEVQERHLEAVRAQAIQRSQKIWVITPRVEVHDTLTIDPGLIDINIGYGYMCAADVTTTFPFSPAITMAAVTLPGGAFTTTAGRTPPAGMAYTAPPPRTPSTFVDEATTPAMAVLADAIARCRRRCWETEHEVFGARIGETPFAPARELTAVPDPNALDRLRALKVLLGLMVAARETSGGRVPADASMWADAWERHRWMPTDVPGVGDTPWSRFVSAAGTRNADTRPTTLVAQAPGQAEVYLVSPLRRWITSPATLDLFGGPGVVTEVPAEYLDAIPRGPDVV